MSDYLPLVQNDIFIGLGFVYFKSSIIKKFGVVP
jgi:hypothetical protein